MRLPFHLAMLCIFASTAQAQFTEVFTDSFDEQNINQWEEFDIIGQILTVVTETPQTFHEIAYPGGGVRLSSPPTPDVEFGPARTAIEQHAVSVTNFDLSVDVLSRAPHLDNGFCVSARTREAGPGATDGYFFCGVNIEDGIGFGLNKVIDEEFTDPQLDSTMGDPPVTIAPDEPIRLNFRGIGSSLEAKVFKLTDLNTPIFTLSANDDTLTQGFTGLAVGAGGQEFGTFKFDSFGDATFDNYTLSVPEPTAFPAFVFALVTLVARRRKR